jgi:GxxExxY protein
VTENEIARQVVDAAIKVHTRIGPGLLESAYEAVLAYELRARGLHIACQQPMPITYEGVKLDVAFRADLIVEEKVIVEIKAVEQTIPVHYQQLLTYLRAADCRLGLLLNFGAPLMRDGIHRVVNGLADDSSPANLR